MFFTDVRKVEHVGDDIIRIYCCVTRDGLWDDRIMIEIPMASAAKCSRFVMESIAEIHNNLEMAQVVGRA